MSSPGGTGHSLAFRVMRLCRPALQVDLGLRFDPMDLIQGEDLHDGEELQASIEAREKEGPYWRRSELEKPIDALGLPGLLVLPQTFGSIYLGESFCSYISVGNHTSHDVRDVGIKAELQTERQRVTLYDSTKAPMDFVRAGGRHDFIIEHDIKELGPHTLVCMAVYTDSDGERKYLPQYFKFLASNPLSVRTKVRTVKETTYLEACIENSTKSLLFLDHVRFDPQPPMTVTVLEVESNDNDESEGPLSGLLKQIKVIKANGGTRHFLYQFHKPAGAPVSAKADGSNTLGKLEIMWRTTLGEPGRLQTQQILGNPSPRKEVSLRIVELPSRIVVERPFQVRMSVSNQTDRAIGPLQISISQDDDQGVPRAIVVNGLWSMTVPQLEPLASTDVYLSLLATAVGVQKITGITVADRRDGKPYDTLTATEVFVELE
ncbi:hypothetical protein M758_6G085200 [Ceratodon purpureus]|nr:hypothetical protein M758_6G085200 [Ceratodon purpureus]